MKLCWPASIMFAVLSAASPAAAQVEFRHALDNSPLEVKPRPNEVETDAVKTFKVTGTNPYLNQEAALAQGKKLYEANCQSCHLKDGSGRLGPSLIGDKWVRERAATDVGMFEVIFAGATGAMQPFSKRMSHEDILRVMAYVRTLKG